MKVLVCGSRRFRNDFVVSLAIDQRMSELPEGSEVIHGGAAGADMLAAESAFRHGHAVTVFIPDWDHHGKRAGVLRNLAMLDEKPDLVIAFWDGQSRGTSHTIGEARRRDIPVEVYTP